MVPPAGRLFSGARVCHKVIRFVKRKIASQRNKSESSEFVPDLIYIGGGLFLRLGSTLVPQTHSAGGPFSKKAKLESEIVQAGLAAGSRVDE
jgi:hypothetical protein